MARGFQGIPGGGGNMQQLMKQAQKMQKQMVELQEALDERTYEASAGGGMVTAKVSGKRELLELTIDPQAVDPDDVELLQDMVIAAVNEALRAGEETRETEMSKLGGGMGGMF
ncbi:YbaB/EbfC family nucleoid-associated protein [Eubacteriales bacterium OttesenSCG-928-A19]|nr:YbaB/EbfC family nucleoid-associated protein [Eubacteriales bacterium OttesenSCG-928-A19]